MYASGGDYSLDVKSGYEDIYNEDKEGFDYRQDKWFQVLGDYEATGLRCMKIVDRYKVKQASRPVAKLSGLNMIRLPELHSISLRNIICVWMIRIMQLNILIPCCGQGD